MAKTTMCNNERQSTETLWDELGDRVYQRPVTEADTWCQQKGNKGYIVCLSIPKNSFVITGIWGFIVRSKVIKNTILLQWIPKKVKNQPVYGILVYKKTKVGCQKKYVTIRDLNKTQGKWYRNKPK